MTDNFRRMKHINNKTIEDGLPLSRQAEDTLFRQLALDHTQTTSSEWVHCARQIDRLSYRALVTQHCATQQQSVAIDAE